MTLTELRYLVALAQEKHFGRAAQTCHVSQPTLSLAIKKLEEGLNVRLFERSTNEVLPTGIGLAVVEQAQVVLKQVEHIKALVQAGQDPIGGPLNVGVIYTIGPYLLPDLVRQVLQNTPQMPLVLQENYTNNLLKMLRDGDLDCAILAEPFADAGLAVAPLYDEPFWAAVPKDHPFAKSERLSAQELQGQTMFLLGEGHCFRDHVLAACPNLPAEDGGALLRSGGGASHSGFHRSFEGSSLETIKHMVAAGMGVTLVPRLSISGRDDGDPNEYVRYVPVFDAQGREPVRRVVLVWRRSFTRYEAIAALRNAIYACPLEGVTRLT